MREVKLKQVGIMVGGLSYLNLWGGGQGEIEMSDTFLPLDKITPKNILRCVNDNGFGCESIYAAKIAIYIQYENGYGEIDRVIDVNHPVHTQYFLGWAELAKQGI